MKYPRVSIIGLGQVGKAFLHALNVEDIEVVSVFNRTDKSSSFYKKYPDIFYKTGFPEQNDPLGDLIILAVSDDAIPEIARRLSNVIQKSESLYVIHCSGTHSSEVLDPLSSKGIKIASFHPIKAITKSTTSFKGIWFDMEGHEELLTVLEELAEVLGAYSFRVDPEAKPFLHASAVVASNYLVVLADLVSKISAQGNISEETAIKALAPLMESTLSNISELGVTDALTGPIARGDIQTIQKHLQSLEAAPGLMHLYKTLGREAVEIAQRKKTSSALNKIKDLLS